jgi:predicted metalloprotease
MKTFTFSGYGVHSQSFKYEIEITSAELAKEMDISVEEVEAMTEEEMKAYMKEKMYVLEGLVDSGDNSVDISWGDTECNCDSDFYLDINEDGE